MRIGFYVLTALIGLNEVFAGSPWVVQPSGTTERLRGVAAVNDQVVWATGSKGTCIRTLDGGTTWQAVPAMDAGKLDFRDVAAFGPERAFLLAIGPGEASRVFKTTHEGASLVECYRNDDPKGFFDAIAFWDADHGLSLSDPVDGRFRILATQDGGRTWEQPSDPGTMPPALPNEGAFAASGTCLIVGTGDNAWFATGGASRARVFHSVDRGRSWTVADAPIRAGEASRGIFGLAFRDAMAGIAVGGDYKKIGEASDNLATTTDGGLTWIPRQFGFRSAVAYLPGPSAPALLTVGPGGSNWSPDAGQTWRALAEAEGYHALAVAPSGRFAWAVGEGGRVGRLTVADALKAP